MDPHPRGALRLLSLSGGGARGIFQARFLQCLEERLGEPLAKHFDAVAATSTGAIVGLAIAAGIPASRVVQLYKEHSAEIFRARTMGALRKGPRYDVRRLELFLEREFGHRKISELSMQVFVTASVVDTHEGRVFTVKDGQARLVDVALASAGAPTYFPPRRMFNDERSYLDGGLWANDPTFVAVHELLHEQHVALDELAILAVGTGRVQRGMSYEEVASMRPASLKALRFIFDIVPSLQAWQGQVSLEKMLLQDQVVVVNPILPEWIPLDDARRSVNLLPAIADSELERSWRRIERVLNRIPPAGTPEEVRSKVDLNVAAGVTVANLRTFIPARKYYTQFRGKGSITEYITGTTRELVLVSINLMTGDAIESILRTIRTLLSRIGGPPVRVTLSLLDPEKTYLIEAVAANLDVEPQELTRAVERLITKFRTFHDGLPEEMRERFQLRCHGTLPSASAILIDPFEPSGTIQLETKAYKTPAVEAYGFEVGAGSEFYVSLRDAYMALVRDGRQVF